MERNHSKQLRALVSIPSQDNHGSIPQSGKLLSFMPLDVGILEKQLLEEQQRIMEQEQEQLMLQWAAPTRHTVGSGSPTVSTNSPPAMQGRSPMQVSRSGTDGIGLGTHRSAPPSHVSQSGSAWGIGQHAHGGMGDDMDGFEGGTGNMHEMQSPRSGALSCRSIRSRAGASEQGAGNGREVSGQPGTPAFVSKQVRPEVIKPITHLSVRLAQVMQARQQEVAAAAAATQAAAVQAAATAAQQASSRHASGLLPLGVHGFPLPQHQLLQPNQGHTPGVTTSDPRSQHWPGNRSSASQVVVLLPPTAHWAADGLDGEGDLARVGGRVGQAAGALLSPHDLKGSALAHRALGSIERAERMLQRLKEGGQLQDSRPSTRDRDALQQLDLYSHHLALLQQAGAAMNPGQNRSSTNIPNFHRTSNKTAKVWAKSMPQNGMLRTVHTMARAASRRQGVSLAPRSLALSFIESLQQGDDFSLVAGAKRRLQCAALLQRLGSTDKDHSLRPEELQKLQHRGLRLAHKVLHSLDATPAAPAPPGSTAGRGPLPHPLQAISEKEAQSGAEEGEDEWEEELTEQERIYGKGVYGIVDNIIVPRVVTTPDGCRYSGAFGRLKDFKRRLRHERAALIQHNPTAFQEEMAEMAEAQYRAMAERAQFRHQVAQDKMTEPRLVQDFMKAVKYLQAERPFFLPPLMERAHVKRPHVQTEVKTQPDWLIANSVFSDRRKECEARDYLETDKVKVAQFQLDWQRVVAKTRFRRLVMRSDEGVKSDEQGLERELAEIRLEMSRFREQLRAIFLYYGSLSVKMNSEDMLTITASTWLQFCSEAHVLDNTQRGCTSQDLQNVFIATNYEEDKVSQESEANDDDAMMRFEFYEGLVRAAFGKFITTKLLDDASDAVASFMEKVVLPHVPPEALLVPDHFRVHRLYTREVDACITEHLPLLKAVHKLYKAKDRTKYFWIEHWWALLDGCRLAGPHTGVEKRDAKLLFSWSQMVVSDELRRRKRAVGLMFFDFVEAVARLADFVSFMDEEQLNTWFWREQGLDSQRLQRLVSQPGRLGRPRLSDSTGANVGLPVTLQTAPSLGDSPVTDAPTPGTGPAKLAAGATEPAALAGGDLYVQKLLEYFRLVGKDAGKWRRESAGAVSTPTRPLHVKIELLLKWLVFHLKEQWGGKDETDCARKMIKTATMISGGIEMA
ncbi:hypothetical protein V8C86DRAFT_2677050 [Haematococcus lacustris]